MLIQITNTCRMGCPHCLQNSTPEPQHMTLETAKQAHDFALKSDSKVILISGGEPTEHPQFEEIVKLFLNFGVIVIVSNGMWQNDPQKVDMITRLMKNKNVSMQITNIEDIYPKRIDTLWFFRFPRTAVYTEQLHIKALGRAAKNEKFLKMAAEDEYTMSCLSSISLCAQVGYLVSIHFMESRGKFCHPLVDFHGDIHWSESWLCPSFGNVSEDFHTLEQKAQKWRPCCKCPDYKKLCENKDYKYLKIREILNV